MADRVPDVQGDEPIVVYEQEDNPLAVLQFAESQVGFMNRVMALALGRTNESDWVLQSGKGGPVPYLQATGAEKVMRLFGVTVTGLKEKRYLDGKDYVWEYSGTFSFAKSPLQKLEAVGSRSSGDKFYQEQLDKTGRIDERDVKMAAYSNFIVNGVTRLLGLRGLTLDDLKMAKLDPKKMRGVEYKDRAGDRKQASSAGGQGSAGGEAGTTQPSAEPAISQEEQEAPGKLFELIKQVAGENRENQVALLEEITSFEGKEGEWVKGVRTMKAMNPRRINVTYGKFKRAIEDRKYPTDGSWTPDAGAL